jgi:phage tail sheath protein FI
MAVNPTYPGVYVEEVPSGVRPITGVSTSNTAFVGYFRKGPIKKPVRVNSFAEFEREFGGLDTKSPTSYAVQQYYLNGGQVAFIVRVASGTPKTAAVDLDKGSSTVLALEASSAGSWGKEVEVAIGHPSTDIFNLVVRRVAIVGGVKQVVETEIHRSLSMKTDDPKFVKDVLQGSSRLVRATTVTGTDRPDETKAGVDPTTPSAIGDLATATTAFKALTAVGTMDGTPPSSSSVLTDGVKTLDGIAPQVFNLLVMPEAADLSTDSAIKTAYSDAEKYCADHRAFLLVDIPHDVDTNSEMNSWMTNVGSGLTKNAAVYFPRLEIADRLNEDRARNVAASGTMAGVFARTDSNRGVWKAPAGTEAVLRGASVVTKLTDLQNGELNPQGVNVLRSFPVYGSVAWGARTLDGADQKASEYKYVPVRRTALFIEESLYQGLKWVVFEPNADPLWAQIRLNVGAFMNTLFRQGAFQGTTPRDAYLVKCDSETTTQNDIDNGVVNILVGFAPLKPAEFVIIKIQQLAGQIQT